MSRHWYFAPGVWREGDMARCVYGGQWMDLDTRQPIAGPANGRDYMVRGVGHDARWGTYLLLAGWPGEGVQGGWSASCFRKLPWQEVGEEPGVTAPPETVA